MRSNEWKKDGKTLAALTARNIKIFFRDKGTLIGALIAPMILLLLYALFLHRVFLQSFDGLTEGLTVARRTVNGIVAAYEVSSVLAVCSVTVAFVANMNMVQDRVSGARNDIDITPAKGWVVVLGYYFATAIVTLIVCYAATAVGFCYIAGMGWGLTAGDAFCILLDVFLSVLFGTALSSLVCYFLKSGGAINAVSTLVSSVYGFICGAYYPISQFSAGMANAIMCLPGTYCTGLFRTHFLGGYGKMLAADGVPADTAQRILGGFDCEYSFFGHDVKTGIMYLVVCCAVLALIAAFVSVHAIGAKSRRARKR